MYTKELTAQEKEVVRDLERELIDIEGHLEVLYSHQQEFRSRKNQITQQLNEITSPFEVGDIVIDEEEVKYRVTRVTGSRPMGIRLAKTGAEAHKDPRTIWSNKLTKVEE